MPSDTTDTDSTDPEDIPSLDEQEWTLGDLRTGVIEFRGMQFAASEPESDAEVEEIITATGGDLTEQFRTVLRIILDLTDEHLEEMTAIERALLAADAIEWLGFDDFDADPEAIEQALSDE